MRLERWFRSASAQDTEHVGLTIARAAQPGDQILLTGELGAGKTTLIRGFARALGCTGPVRSPSYQLVEVLDTNPPMVHADLFRVDSAEGIGLEDYSAGHIVAIEWAERLSWSPPEVTWEVRIEVVATSRLLRVLAPQGRAWPR